MPGHSKWQGLSSCHPRVGQRKHMPNLLRMIERIIDILCDILSLWSCRVVMSFLIPTQSVYTKQHNLESHDNCKQTTNQHLFNKCRYWIFHSWILLFTLTVALSSGVIFFHLTSKGVYTTNKKIASDPTYIKLSRTCTRNYSRRG